MQRRSASSSGRILMQGSIRQIRFWSIRRFLVLNQQQGMMNSVKPVFRLPNSNDFQKKSQKFRKGSSFTRWLKRLLMTAPGWGVENSFSTGVWGNIWHLHHWSQGDTQYALPVRIVAEQHSRTAMPCCTTRNVKNGTPASTYRFRMSRITRQPSRLSTPFFRKRLFLDLNTVTPSQHPTHW